MSLIVLIAPNEEIGAVAERAKQQYDLDMDIYVGLMEQGVAVAEKLKDKGAKVFISRGGTAILMRKKLQNHVVAIKMVLDDAVCAISEAQKYGKNIMFAGFSNHLQGFASLGPLLGLQIQQCVIKDWKEGRTKMLEGRDNGVDVVIGGAMQTEVALEIGMPTVFLGSSEAAVLLAYSDAKAMLNIILAQERQAKELHTILDYSGDGFVSINKNSQITLVNDFGGKVFGVDSNTVIGEALLKVMPLIANLSDALNPEAKLHNDVISIGSFTLLYNRIPLVNEGKIVGAMATLKDIKTVQKEDYSIRYKQYSKVLYAKYHFDDIIGCSEAICKIKQVAENFAKTEATILITSESGTGKELFAQSIHNASSRRNGPFVAINCASLAESIFESELFGYVDGAFTGTRKSGKAGMFEMAEGGTIFLDEIGEVPINLQGKLLRVLQERNVMRLGDDKIIPVDVRFIAATNRNLVNEIQEGNFRMDLFFRLNVLRLAILPLRDRKDDILILAKTFLQKYGCNEDLILPGQILDTLKEYNWPGNIRELENLMERIAVIGHEKNIMGLIHEYFSDFNLLEKYKKVTLDREKVERSLEITEGNKTKAAKYLGVNRSTLWRFLEKNEK
ncbi:MAG: sigma 54-interacting transcriptional regulator [Peptostreptococcaceae bacterium]|nr:sigma 54-interacting transcriptional regulator [Peptostreptococcaceae bacterium]